MTCGEEVWVVTTRHPAYEVSSWGRVRNSRTGRVLKTPPNSRGYSQVSLTRKIKVYVHQLVAEAFHGPGRAGLAVDHVDWRRDHNCVRNVRWLPKDLNDVRWWNGRTSDNRNVWATPDTPAEDLLDGCSHEPLTREQEEALLADLDLAGWTKSASA